MIPGLIIISFSLARPENILFIFFLMCLQAYGEDENLKR